MTTAPDPASGDHYRDAARGWAEGAEKVYAPLAVELVATARRSSCRARPCSTWAPGPASDPALRAAGARPVAVDRSVGMLRHGREGRPPATVGDISHLPLRTDAVEHALAPFVLNHLEDPLPALAELGRVTRPGGEVLATTFSNESRHEARERIDVVAARYGWEPPSWYVRIKERAVPRLGSAPAMRAAATAAGLVDVEVAERPVDVGVDQAEDLVAYRLGQAHAAEFLATLTPDDEARLRTEAVATVAEVMTPYRPVVVFLVARVAPAVG